jgi:mono/diheme cytochrome c family protein
MMRRSALLPARWILLLIALAIPACVSLDTVAPPVSQVVATRTPLSQLEAGRRIYLGKCTACHAAEPIRNYTIAQWDPIMVEMAEETNLTAEEDAAVRAYIRAVLATPAGA